MTGRERGQATAASAGGFRGPAVDAFGKTEVEAALDAPADDYRPGARAVAVSCPLCGAVFTVAEKPGPLDDLNRRTYASLRRELGDRYLEHRRRLHPR